MELRVNPSESDLTVPVVVSVVLIALVAISVAAFFIWKRKKGQRDQVGQSLEANKDLIVDNASELVRYALLIVMSLLEHLYNRPLPSFFL